MKVIVIFLSVLLAGAIGWSAYIPTPEQAALGRFIVTPFATAPFPHSSRANGHQYHNKFYSAATNYSDSTVALFIPNGFRATDRVDLVVHFHGWMNTVASTLTQYQLPEQFAASGRNAIFIVPEGPHNAPDSSGGRLEETNGFQRFIAEAMATLKKARVCSNDAVAGDIILSGHSGGYQVISSILDHGGLSGQVREVWLFDALYAHSDEFLAWAAAGQGRLLDIYTDHGGTLENSQAMIATLRQQGKTLIATNDVSITPAELAASHYAFLHTDLPHNDVPTKRKSFEEFLETSFLPSIK
jgi:hypothetical protein